MSKWISVKKRIPLPHKGDGPEPEYLVFRQGFTGVNIDKNGYEILTMQGQASWHLQNAGYGFGITHWMKLPTAPDKIA